MDQQAPQPRPQPPAPTGVAAVDAVLAQVSNVAERPVAEHAAVFERAHEQLRRALDAQPESRPDNEQGA